MQYAVFGVGWTLALVILSHVHARPVDWICAVLFLVASVILVTQRRYPRREKALITSWLGVLLLAASASFIASNPLPPANSLHSSEALLLLRVKHDVFQGWLLAVFMVWFFRLYGIVPILASASAFVPEAKRPRVYADAEEYPWKFWFVMPFVAVTLALVKISFLVLFAV